MEYLGQVFLISLDLHKNEKDEYVILRMSVQPKVLELLQCLPVSVGLGVRRDIVLFANLWNQCCPREWVCLINFSSYPGWV